jgi:hypothetical protein
MNKRNQRESIMIKSKLATFVLGSTLAAVAFSGSAIGQEAPYLVGKYSANVERVLQIPEESTVAAQPNTTSTFGYAMELRGTSRPVADEAPVHGNYSANVRMHDLHGQ